MRDAWFRDLRLLDHEGHDLGPFTDRQGKQSREAAKPQRGKTARRTTTRWEDPACREVGLGAASAWVAFLGHAPKGRTRYCLKDHKKTQKAGYPCSRGWCRRWRASWASCDSWFRDLRLFDHEGHEGHELGRAKTQRRKWLCSSAAWRLCARLFSSLTADGTGRVSRRGAEALRLGASRFLPSSGLGGFSFLVPSRTGRGSKAAKPRKEGDSVAPSGAGVRLGKATHGLRRGLSSAGAPHLSRETRVGRNQRMKRRRSPATSVPNFLRLPPFPRVASSRSPCQSLIGAMRTSPPRSSSQTGEGSGCVLQANGVPLPSAG